MSKTFEFTLEELLQLEKENPDNENIQDLKLSKENEHVHCCECNWEVTKLFVLADTREKAVQLLLSGDAGLCGECYAEMLGDKSKTNPLFFFC